MLFLAKFAPIAGSQPDKEAVPYSAHYHQEIFELLRALPLNVTPSRDVLDVIGLDADYIFSLYNRVRCNNGEVFVTAICEYRGLPYMGAAPHLRAVAEDKHLAKLLAQSVGVRTPKWARWTRKPTAFSDGHYFVKPRYGAASGGISDESFCITWEDVRRQAEGLVVDGIEPLVEEFIVGDNVTVPVLGGPSPRLLTPVEIPSSNLRTVILSTDKFSLTQGHDYLPYEGPILDDVLSQAARFVDSLDPFDYTRLDFRATSRGAYFLEFNLGCDISSFGSFAFAAKLEGISQTNLLGLILANSLWRSKLI